MKDSIEQKHTVAFRALIAAFLAAMWPAVRLMRTPPSTLLRVFASER